MPEPGRTGASATDCGHPAPMTDPVTVVVLLNRLAGIAEEMGEAMLRTA